MRNVGCLLANRLSANPENRLLLIEHQPGEGIGTWCQEIGMRRARSSHRLRIESPT